MSVIGAAKLRDAMPLIADQMFQDCSALEAVGISQSLWCLHVPYVRSCASQDVTNNPLWTGKTEGLGAEDEHMQKFMKRFAGLDSINVAGAKTSTDGGDSAAEGAVKGDAKR